MPFFNLIILLVQFVFILLSIALFTLVERKVLSSIQRRIGPDTVGLFGFLQPFADGLKLVSKELILPTNANIPIFIMSPVFTLFFTFVLWTSLPLANSYMVLELPFGLIFLLAISSLSVHTLIFAGWASNSKYAFLGGIRSASQMISYELCIGALFSCIILMSGSYSLSSIIFSQKHISFALPLLPMWILFMLSALAETNRAPFDLPEAEAELVAGYNVEYSAIAFAMFFLAEYGNILVMSCLGVILFWGKYSYSFNIILTSNILSFLDEYKSIEYKILFVHDDFLKLVCLNIEILNFIFFAAKVCFHMFVFLWVRGALPRYRYDQLMKLGWKILIPLCFTLLMVQSSMMLSLNIFPFI